MRELLLEPRGEVFELGETFGRYVAGRRFRRSQELGCFFINLVEDRCGFRIEKLGELWIDICLETLRRLRSCFGFIELDPGGLGFRRRRFFFRRSPCQAMTLMP